MKNASWMKLTQLVACVLIVSSQASADNCVTQAFRRLLGRSQSTHAAQTLEPSVLKQEPRVMKPTESAPYQFQVKTSLPPKTRQLPGDVGKRVNQTVEKVVARMNDSKEWGRYIKKLQDDTRTLMLKSGDPQALALAQNGNISREYMLKVIANRAAQRGQGMTVVTELGEGVDSQLGRAVSNGDLFLDQYWSGNTLIGHGVDVHLIQMDYVDSVVVSGMKGDRATFYGTIFREPLLPASEGRKNTFWDLAFDAQSFENKSRAASPEDLNRWLHSQLPVK